MNALRAALFAELLKARRSLVPWITFAGFSLAPLAGGLFMVIMKDPDAARDMGIISAKAQIMAGTADWPTFLGLLAQTVAIGGLVVFAIATSWVFGREAVDRTAKCILALPTPRHAIVTAKFVTVALWSLALTVYVYVLGLAVGALVGLPLFSTELVLRGAGNLLAAGGLTLALTSLVAFVASATRGYLAPFGFAVLVLILANVVAATGWGMYFPWAVPALLTAAAGEQGGDPVAASYVLVALTSVAGLAATYVWWYRADQTR